jgi:MoaA/NifB/PqqE/SkfB family radical SAM enzyme
MTDVNSDQAVASYFKYNPTGAFSVDWYIGKRCNFSCSYCVDYLHDNYSAHVPLENMTKLVDLIYADHGTNVFWSLTGGEPTINPKFMDLARYIKHEKGARFVSLTTNGSRTTKYFTELFQYIDGITLSFHFEHMADRIDEYIEKCIAIDDWRLAWNREQEQSGKRFPDEDQGYVRKTLILRFMVYPGQFENAARMEKAFRDHGITNIEHRYIRPPGGNSNELLPDKKLDFGNNHDVLDKKYIVNNHETTTIKAIETREKQFYSEDEKEKIKEIYKATSSPEKRKLKVWLQGADGSVYDRDYHYNEVNFEKRNNFEGWICWAGVKHLKVTPTGDIYIGSCHVGGKRGNIYDRDSIDLPTEPIRCPKWRCTDNLDLKVPKIRDWEHYGIVKDMIEWKPK